MTIFGTIRKHLGLTQASMAELCELGRNAWMNIESGRTLPSLDVARRIEEASGRLALPHQGQELTAKEVDWWSSGARYDLPAVNGEAWRRAGRNSWHTLRFPVDPDRRLWMETFLPAQSSVESRVLLEFAHAGARPQLSSPSEVGLRDLPILDAQGFALGERRLPGLRGEVEEVHFLLWPQVHLRPDNVTYCVDALLRLRSGRKSAWCILEVDGKGHNSQNDVFRADSLKLHCIRISHEQAHEGRAVQVFLEGLGRG